MSNEKLSQSEIDALINAVRSGGENVYEEMQVKKSKKDEYRAYDFDRPEKFSVENLKSIEIICKNFSKGLAQALTAKLRTPLTIEFNSIEQMPFQSDYADIWVRDYYAFCITDLGHPDLREIVLEIDLAFVLALHNRWLGREMPSGLNERKPLTDIEQFTLVKLLNSIVYENLETAFSSIATIEPRFIKHETDPQLLKITTATDMIVLVTLDVKTQDWTTTIRMVIPFLSVEEIIDKLTTENIREAKYIKRNDYRKEIEKGLENVEEDVHISIGDLQMTIEDLSSIEPGDVLVLNRKTNESSYGFAAGVHKFNCFIGRDKTKKAFRFTEFANAFDIPKAESETEKGE